MKTSEVLNKAADLIEERGWGQGVSTWSDRGHGLCLEGGIIAALDDETDLLQLRHCPSYRAVSDYLGRDVESDIENSVGVWRWNDAPGRTAEEVIEVLRAAAVIEASREEAVERVSA